MFYFEVPDMFSCRSVGAISKSVKAIDHEATVVIDMVHHSVAIESGRLAEEAVQEAIGQAGFTPIPRHPVETVDILLPLAT